MNIKIPVKKKIFPLMLLGAITICVVLYFLIIQTITTGGEGVYYYLNLSGFLVLFIYAICFALIIFLSTIKILFNKKAGLFITDDCIDYNIGIMGNNLIQWNDIIGLEITKTRSQKSRYIIIKLADNDKYLARKNLIQKFILKKFISKYGTPIIIPLFAIDYKPEALAQVIAQQLNLKKIID